jgi:hypothetical protein
MVMAVIVTVAPWVIRNAIVMGRPLLTTTHGGYTLLLGNNPAYYREVVDQPLGTIWDGSHGPGQAAWAAELNRELDALNLRSEVERDRWMSRQARSYIVADPAHFARACALRVLRFWSIKPAADADEGFSRPLVAGVAVFYTTLFAAAVGGLVGVLRRDGARWMPLLLLITAFALVHFAYWTDARMRAPIMPALAILAASAGCRPARREPAIAADQRAGDPLRPVSQNNLWTHTGHSVRNPPPLSSFSQVPLVFPCFETAPGRSHARWTAHRPRSRKGCARQWAARTLRAVRERFPFSGSMSQRSVPCCVVCCRAYC